MIRAVIFDMDGVLIDSEMVYLEYLFQKMKGEYPKITIKKMKAIVGAHLRQTLDILYEASGSREDREIFDQKIQDWFDCEVYYPDILRKEVPGLLRILRERGYLLGLASSTSTGGIRKVLTQCELTESFDYVVSGDMFQESKPNPEIYLHSAARLGCCPQECFVVEDSTYGIQAAAAANMTIAAIRDARFDFDQTPATYHIEKLNDLLDLLPGV